MLLAYWKENIEYEMCRRHLDNIEINVSLCRRKIKITSTENRGSVIVWYQYTVANIG